MVLKQVHKNVYSLVMSFFRYYVYQRTLSLSNIFDLYGFSKNLSGSLDVYYLHPADPTAIFVARLSFMGFETFPLLNIWKEMLEREKYKYERKYLFLGYIHVSIIGNWIIRLINYVLQSLCLSKRLCTIKRSIIIKFYQRK